MTCGSYTSTEPQAGDLCLVISLCDEAGTKFIGKESLFIRSLVHKENFTKLQAKNQQKKKKQKTVAVLVKRTRTSRLRIFRMKFDEEGTNQTRNSSAFQKRTGSYFENVVIKFWKQ